MDDDCVNTLRLQAEGKPNPPHIIHKRIEDVRSQGLKKRLGLDRGDLGLLAGGPPCQPFTTTGLRQATNDPRASSLFPAYFEFVRHFLPRTVLIENVDGMLSAALWHRKLEARTKAHPPLKPDEQKGSFLKWFLDQLVALGYSVAWGVLEAADYGVPQMRQRAIIIGVRGKEPCFLPLPRFGWDGLAPYRTLRSALAGVTEPGPVQPLSERKRDVYAKIPAGGNWRDLPEVLQKETMGAAYTAEGGKSGWWRRLSWDLPAPTILGMPDHSSTALIHPDEVRCLSVNECAALQSFQGVRFAGMPRSQYQQIGNAVPVLMAQAFGEHLRRFLDGERLPPPTRPPWRQESANRRIGTHGWGIPSKLGPRYYLTGAIRPDHVWRGVLSPSLFDDCEEEVEQAVP
jgi:DNA (cytosine-5)-methyltransferase 1